MFQLDRENDAGSLQGELRQPAYLGAADEYARDRDQLAVQLGDGLFFRLKYLRLGLPVEPERAVNGLAQGDPPGLPPKEADRLDALARLEQCGVAAKNEEAVALLLNLDRMTG